MRKFLLYAILPALIAGLFSLAPKIYDIAKEPSAELVYAITSGPELQVGSKFRRILSIRITNAGKKSLHDVQADLVLPSGSIESSRVQVSSGLRPDVKEIGNAISISVKTLHPKEQFAVSAMTLIPNTSVIEDFHLRSNEVLGRKAKETGEKKKALDIIGALSSGISVFVMSMMFFVYIRKRGGFPGYDREDIIFYIFVRLGLTQLSDQIRFAGVSLKYIRAADILLEYALRGDPEVKAKCITALECLFLVPNIVPSSLKAIEQDMAILVGGDNAKDKISKIKQVSKSAASDKGIRQIIEQYIDKATFSGVEMTDKT